RAHRAGLERHVQHAAGEPMIAEPETGLPHGDDLGVGGRVVLGDVAVPALAEHLPGGRHQHSPDGDLVVLARAARRQRQRVPHPPLIVFHSHPRRIPRHPASLTIPAWIPTTPPPCTAPAPRPSAPRPSKISATTSPPCRNASPPPARAWDVTRPASACSRSARPSTRRGCAWPTRPAAASLARTRSRRRPTRPRPWPTCRACAGPSSATCRPTR